MARLKCSCATFERRGVELDGFVASSHLTQHDAQIQVGVRAVGRQRNGLTVGGLGRRFVARFKRFALGEPVLGPQRHRLLR